MIYNCLFEGELFEGDLFEGEKESMMAALSQSYSKYLYNLLQKIILFIIEVYLKKGLEQQTMEKALKKRIFHITLSVIELIYNVLINCRARALPGIFCVGNQTIVQLIKLANRFKYYRIIQNQQYRQKQVKIQIKVGFFDCRLLKLRVGFRRIDMKNNSNPGSWVFDGRKFTKFEIESQKAKQRDGDGKLCES